MKPLRDHISVIIVNWNGGERLLDCLRSLRFAVSSFEAEVWLVDNASGDGSAEKATEAFPEVRLIANKMNLGFAAAVNQALEKAEGNLILLLNPDARIETETLARLVEVMKADWRIGIAGCSSVDEAGRFVPGFEMSFPGQRKKPVSRAGEHGVDVAWVSGACLLARKAMIERIGPMDPKFFMYYEDVDWCYRARAAKWRVVTAPEVMIQHDLGGCSSGVPRQETDRRAAASRLRFYRKYYPGWRSWGLTMKDLIRRLRR